MSFPDWLIIEKQILELRERAELSELENKSLREQLAHSFPLDPSLSDKFEIRERSVFLILNGVAHLAGVRELEDIKERDSLRSEHNTLRTERDKFKHLIEQWQKDAGELREQNQALLADKERLDWLENDTRLVTNPKRYVIGAYMTGSTLRDAIDFAMKKGTQ